MEPLVEKPVDNETDVIKPPEQPDATTGETAEEKKVEEKKE